MDDNNINAGGRYYGGPPDNLPQPPLAKQRRRQRRQSPQETVQQFWDRLNSKYPGKVFTVLPDNPYARQKAARTPHGTVHGQHVARSYEEAKAECIRDVDRIIKECRRLNQKYRDPHFDIEWDLKSGQRNCLDGLSVSGDAMKPKGVKRVTDIFEKPQFYVNGPTAGDVRQGRDGDCYLMAALCGLGNKPGLIDKVCVRRDQKVGVYGFVFHRDGEWQHTIVDDKLYLRAPDYDEAQDERIIWDDINRVDADEEYRKTHQTGSRALYFAQCSDENETWLPLLEKAYAKAHGDFASIDGGFTGEAIEDLTGGVTQEIYSTDILDRDEFWRDELMQVGKHFLFGCATGFYSNWLDTSSAPREREGISEGHAYSIMEAREIEGQRLLKVRNPWGKKEWTGRWSDGSSEWTPEWMQRLDHKFGNDGIFWISYEDLLKKYQHFDRTRIFGSEWSITQCWTSVNVSWNAEYHSTKFSLTIDQSGPVVIVLSQLDDTYFSGLEGPYGFDLHFRLESDAKEDEDDYIVRSNGNYAMARSVSTDIELEAGTYSVLMKITATRNPDKEHIEEVLPLYAATRREKLIQMGLSYDLAHAKGVLVETEDEKRKRKVREKMQKAKDREKMKERMRQQAEKHWRKEKERHLRNKSRRERKERADAKKGHLGGEIVIELDTGRSPRRGDSMSVHRSDSPLQDGARKDEKTPTIAKKNSLNGVDMGKGSERRTSGTVQRGQAAPPTTVATMQRSPEAVEQTLEEVLKIADAETNANAIRSETNGVSSPDAAGPTASHGQNGKPTEDLSATPVVQINGADAVTNVKPLANPPISKPDADLSASAPAEPSAQPATGEAPTDPNQRPQHEPTRSTTLNRVNPEAGHDMPLAYNDEVLSLPAPSPPLSATSCDSFPSFDWNSVLDLPSESPSVDTSDEESPPPRRHRGRRRGRRGGSVPAPPPPPPPLPEAGVDDEPAAEEWNAVCVVGLRVYSTGKGVHLKVVTGTEGTDEETKKAEGVNGEMPGRGKGRELLDPDDHSRGAVAADAGRPEASQAVTNGEKNENGSEELFQKQPDIKAGTETKQEGETKEEGKAVGVSDEEAPPGQGSEGGREHPLSLNFIDRLVKGAMEKGEANAREAEAEAEAEGARG